MMLGNAFTVQYAFPNMESIAMLSKKSNNIRKITKTVLIVGDDVWGAAFRIQCAFPNMEGVAMLNEKSNKIGKMTKTKVDGAHCW